MRILIICAVLLFVAVEAEARNCKLPSRGGSLTQDTASRAFMKCLLNEIKDLKKRQKELEQIVPEYERLIAELPAPYLNDNRTITVEPGRRIGSAKFILDARLTGGVSSLPVEQSVLEQLCAAQQCRLSLIFRMIGFRTGEPIESTIVGPCNFAYNTASGVWIRGTGCPDDALNGMDANAAVGTGENGADVIIVAGEACLLTDAAARTTGASRELFEPDHALGLYLIATPERRTDGTRRFRCDLEIN
ncbi:MAG: hypothetical protein GY947_14780 [Rhodobacteraceae bacterium]|nr:hypothetical protein [Paracoccaceae bacterium]